MSAGKKQLLIGMIAGSLLLILVPLKTDVAPRIELRFVVPDDYKSNNFFIWEDGFESLTQSS